MWTLTVFIWYEESEVNSQRVGVSTIVHGQPMSRSELQSKCTRVGVHYVLCLVRGECGPLPWLAVYTGCVRKMRVTN